MRIKSVLVVALSTGIILWWAMYQSICQTMVQIHLYWEWEGLGFSPSSRVWALPIVGTFVGALSAYAFFALARAYFQRRVSGQMTHQVKVGFSCTVAAMLIYPLCALYLAFSPEMRFSALSRPGAIVVHIFACLYLVVFGYRIVQPGSSDYRRFQRNCTSFLLGFIVLSIMCLNPVAVWP
jgi:hypothetical protein